MNTESMICPKCQGAMIRGFIPDFSYTIRLVSSWHEGAPQKSFWTGHKVSSSDGIPIGAFRCEKCGFLEFYADRQFRTG